MWGKFKVIQTSLYTGESEQVGVYGSIWEALQDVGRLVLLHSARTPIQRIFIGGSEGVMEIVLAEDKQGKPKVGTRFSIDQSH